MSTSDVKFDFDGSLQLARRLWAFADDIERLRDQRGSDAVGALREWRGPFSREFRGYAADERASLTKSAAEMRRDAEAWATSYAKAVDQQNNVLYTRELTRVKNERESRDFFEERVDQVQGWLGFEQLRYPKEAPPCPVPRPGGFAPTNRPQLYF